MFESWWQLLVKKRRVAALRREADDHYWWGAYWRANGADWLSWVAYRKAERAKQLADELESSLK